MIKSKLSIFIVSFCIVMAVSRFVRAEIPVQSSDAEILGVVSVIDQNEIQAAQLATQKNAGQEIQEYARMLNSEHSKHLTMTQQLARQLGVTIVDNTSAINLIRTKGEKDLEALTPLDGLAFAQLYIADMVKGHSEALNWIESQDTQKDQIKAFLQETKKHIAMHLEKAQEIQKHQAIGQS